MADIKQFLQQANLLVESPLRETPDNDEEFFTSPTTRGQNRAFSAARTEARNTEAQLRRQGYGAEVDEALQAEDPGVMSTLLDPIFDLLQVGQFVTAGTALEIQRNGLGWDALKRAGSEFANALPGLEVDEAAEFLGVQFPKATRPSWSEVLKKSDAKIFSDEGAGRWSAAVGGFVLDILLDPLTYVAPVVAVKKIPGVVSGAKRLATATGKTRVGRELGERFIADFGLKQAARENPALKESVASIIRAKQAREIETEQGLVEIKDAVAAIAGNMNAAERRLVGFYLDQPQVLDGVLRQVADTPERLVELRQKADAFRDQFTKIVNEEVQDGLMSPAIIRNNYAPGRYPVTGTSEKAVQDFFEKRGIEADLPRPNVTGDIGPNMQAGAGNRPFQKAKTFETLEERTLAAVPTEMDVALLSFQRGMESVRARATKKFVDTVLSDRNIARRIEGNLASTVNKSEGDIFQQLVESGIDPKAAKAQAAELFKEVNDFKAMLKASGYGIYKPMRAGEPAYVLPEPFIRELDLTDKLMSNKSEARKFLESFNRVQNIWKGYAVLSPGFHARNAFSNWWNNSLGGINPLKGPAPYIRAAMIQAGKADGLVFNIEGKAINGNDILKLAKDHGIVGSGIVNKDLGVDIERELAGALFPKASGRELAKKLADGSLEKDIAATAPRGGIADVVRKTLGQEGILKFNRNAGKAIENNARLAHFVEKLADGLSPEDAARSVKKYLFNYNELTPFERDVMKAVIPFYTWMRFNIPLQIQSILEKPGRYAALSAKPIQAIESLSQEWKDIPTPDYFQELRATRLPKVAAQGVAKLNTMLFPQGQEDQTGFQPTFLNPNLPFQDINRLNFRDIISGLSPVLKFPFEQTPTRGFSFFLDRDIERYTGEPAAVDVLGTGIRLSGKDESAMRSLLPTYGKVQRLRERSDQGQLASQLLTEVFGVKAIQVDIDKVNRAKTFNKREVLRNLKRKLQEMDRTQ